MARGKYFSLEEARKLNKLDKLDQFAKERPSEGDPEESAPLSENASTPTTSSAYASGGCVPHMVGECVNRIGKQRTRVPGAVPGIGPATALPEIPERDLPQHPFCTGAAIPMLGGCGWS